MVAAAFASGRAWLEELAAVMVVSLLLWPGVATAEPAAFMFWAHRRVGIVALAIAGSRRDRARFPAGHRQRGACALFARTLAPGSEPLIARLIAVLESPERVALPRVAGYARALTLAWAHVLGAQALVLALMIFCAVPGGLARELRHRHRRSRSTGNDWRWYLHLGSYATVLALLVVEYAFRRWYLRHIPQSRCRCSCARLVRRWPALAAASCAMRTKRHAHDARSDIVETLCASRRSIRRCPGHFPGNPIVPGVVLLDRIAASIESAARARLARIGVVKFLAPLQAG